MLCQAEFILSPGVHRGSEFTEALLRAYCQNTCNVCRYSLFRGYLASRAADLAGVAILDARDVVLQGNPWADTSVQRTIAAKAAVFSAEGGPGIGGELLVGSAGWNSDTIKAVLGVAVHKQMQNCTVSCSGATIGAPEAVELYLDDMVSAISQIAAPNSTNSTFGDQAVHNYALHVLGRKRLLDGVYELIPNWQSPVHTLQVFHKHRSCKAHFSEVQLTVLTIAISLLPINCSTAGQSLSTSKTSCGAPTGRYQA